MLMICNPKALLAYALPLVLLVIAARGASAQSDPAIGTELQQDDSLSEDETDVEREKRLAKHRERERRAEAALKNEEERKARSERVRQLSEDVERKLKTLQEQKQEPDAQLDETLKQVERTKTLKSPLVRWGIKITIFVVALILLWVFTRGPERRRSKKLEGWALRRGHRFLGRDSRELRKLLTGNPLFDDLSMRGAYNIVEGQIGVQGPTRDCVFYFFDQDVQVGGNPPGQQYSAILLLLPFEFPDSITAIPGTSRLGKLTNSFMGKLVEFESSTFAKLFAVKAKNRKLAFAIFHQMMILETQAYPDRSLVFHGRVIGGRWRKAQPPHRRSSLAKIAGFAAKVEDARIPLASLDAHVSSMNKLQQLLPEYLVEKLMSRHQT